MKILIILVIICLTTFNTYAHDVNKAARYLKLANSYMNSDNLIAAKNFLEKADKQLTHGNTWENKYWKAVYYEYVGYYYSKKSKNSLDTEKSKFLSKQSELYFTKASELYNKILKMKGGSQDIIKSILEDSKIVEGELNKLQSSATTGLLSVPNLVVNYDNIDLEDIPNNLNKEIKNVSMSNSGLEGIPNSVISLTSLEHLNLPDNDIESISQNISSLKKLKYLNLSNNSIEDISDELCKLKNLQILDLSGNDLTTLPECLCELKGLKILNLKGNELDIAFIKNLVRCLPGTNIYTDVYIIEEDEDDEFDFE